MPDEKISQLDAVTDVLDDDDYVLARAGASKRITGASLKADLGGSSSPNWCRITLAVPADPLTVGAPGYDFKVGDVTITEQSGADFAVIDDGSGLAQISSVLGGQFQCGAFVGNPSDATLDGGSSAQRWLIFGASTGDTPGLTNLGLDSTVPIVVGGGVIGAIADTKASTLGVCAPGGVALQNLQCAAAGLFGTDSIVLDNVFGWAMLVLWSV